MGASIAAVIVLAGAAAAIYFLRPRDAARIPEPARVDSPERVAPASPPQPPRHPIESESSTPPLPALKESDGAVAAAFSALIGLDAFAQAFFTENLVRNIVAAVDSLPHDQVSQRVSPLRPVPGTPVTAGKGATLSLAPANAARYARHMRLVESVGTQQLVEFYRRHYPLFQQAYVELGYPNGYFNDRLVEVIDHLLATPEPAEPLRLTQPKVLYEFADPALEELSAGQKMMLRMGKDNRSRMKAKLREIRAAIGAR